MNPSKLYSRRKALKIMVCGATAAICTASRSEAEDIALLSEDDPAAQAAHYVADVSRAKDAQPGSKCANCSLYSGDSNSAQGPCVLFDGKLVKAAGWCSAWTNM